VFLNNSTNQCKNKNNKGNHVPKIADLKSTPQETGIGRQPVDDPPKRKRPWMIYTWKCLGKLDKNKQNYIFFPFFYKIREQKR
jgi:hypothetical protein